MRGKKGGIRSSGPPVWEKNWLIIYGITESWQEQAPLRQSVGPTY